ncbi:hypothetical protein SKAU_G00308110 [Synaphobranchus kaupii]|uniref:Ig-like domain-containing protein n=1 Tax=Synaphobranchus kaupii TaxID=118154 RepID=A0A9Q1IKZ5_SYNKA|nr:hypothetical protein SKAU_G00308110 [Synaphobranchus kaupii]
MKRHTGKGSKTVASDNGGGSNDDAADAENGILPNHKRKRAHKIMLEEEAILGETLEGSSQSEKNKLDIEGRYPHGSWEQATVEAIMNLRTFDTTTTTSQIAQTIIANLKDENDFLRAQNIKLQWELKSMQEKHSADLQATKEELLSLKQRLLYDDLFSKSLLLVGPWFADIIGYIRFSWHEQILKTVFNMTILALLVPTLLAVRVHAAFEVQVPELPVVALYGTDTILNCSFSPVTAFNMSQLSIFWQLTDTRRSVHAFWNERDQLVDQGETFANRTSLFRSRLGSGNASLLLRRVQIADEGSFTCFVRVEDYNSAAMLVQVAAPYSKPEVTRGADSNLRPGDEVHLTCEAYGGYPEASVVWRDGRGHNLTENVTTSVVANKEGLYSVHSVLRVVVEPNSTYSCRLVNPLLGEEGHAYVTVTTQNAGFPPVALWVTVALAVCLLGLLITLAVICHRKIKESEEAEAAEAKENEEEEESKTAHRHCGVRGQVYGKGRLLKAEAELFPELIRSEPLVLSLPVWSKEGM